MARNDDTIAPPHTFTVEDRNRPLLYQADGTPLRRQIGFAMTQTSGVFPALTKGGKKIGGSKPKGGKKGC